MRKPPDKVPTMTTDLHIPYEKWPNFPWLKERTILLTKHGSHGL